MCVKQYENDSMLRNMLCRFRSEMSMTAWERQFFF